MLPADATGVTCGPGARADLAVLDVDLATLLHGDEALADVGAELTLLGGREVHGPSAEDFAGRCSGRRMPPKPSKRPGPTEAAMADGDAGTIRGRFKSRIDRLKTGRAGPTRSSSFDPTLLDFGHYAGRTIEELAGTDPDYLRWLESTRPAIRYRGEIQRVLGDRLALDRLVALTASVLTPAARHGACIRPPA